MGFVCAEYGVRDRIAMGLDTMYRLGPSTECRHVATRVDASIGARARASRSRRRDASSRTRDGDRARDRADARADARADED
jgi:hypothetical protein